MTLDEYDATAGQATEKAVRRSLVAGAPVIYWEDVNTFVLRSDFTKETFPPRQRPPTFGKYLQ